MDVAKPLEGPSATSESDVERLRQVRPAVLTELENDAIELAGQPAAPTLANQLMARAKSRTQECGLAEARERVKRRLYSRSGTVAAMMRVRGCRHRSRRLRGPVRAGKLDLRYDRRPVMLGTSRWFGSWITALVGFAGFEFLPQHRRRGDPAADSRCDRLRRLQPGPGDAGHHPRRVRIPRGPLFDLSGNPLTEEQYPGAIEAQFGANADAVLAQYPVDAYPTPGRALATAGSDARYACPARVADGLFAAHVPTYAYEFNGPGGPLWIVNEPVEGAIHGSDLPHVFQPADAASSGAFTTEQLALSDQMMGYYSRFAAAGNPNNAAAPPWPAYTTAGDQVQSFERGGSRTTTAYPDDHQRGPWASIGG